MNYSNKLLMILLEKMVPFLKQIGAILNSSTDDKTKIFQLKTKLWLLESDSQDNIRNFIEIQLFSPVPEELIHPTSVRYIFVKSQVDCLIFLN